MAVLLHDNLGDHELGTPNIYQPSTFANHGPLRSNRAPPQSYYEIDGPLR
jgi:hypothetical protein